MSAPSADASLKQRLRQLRNRRRFGSAVPRGCDFLAQALTKSVSHIYGVPGRPVYELYRRLAQHGANLIGTKNQQSAALASAAQNYLAGGLVSAVVVSGGPAWSNALTGMLVAERNGWPLLIVVGTARTSTPLCGAFQHIDVPATASTLSKSVYQPEVAEELPQVLQRALIDAQTPPYGPVVLSLTEDLLDAGIATSLDGQYEQLTQPATDHTGGALIGSAEMQEVASLISQASRPLLMLGEALRWVPSESSPKTWLDTKLPYLTALDYKALPTRHTLCADQVAGQALSEADLLIALGAPFDWRLRFGGEVTENTPVIILDHKDDHQFPDHLRCIHRSQGSFAASVQSLLQAIEPNPSIRPWRLRIQTLQDARLVNTAAETQQDLSLVQLAKAVDDCSPTDSQLVFDGNAILLAARQHVQFDSKTLGLTPGITGCMGVGLPFALAAQIHRPDQRVVCLTGDIAFGICAMEIETACRNQLPVIIVVANNEGNAKETLAPVAGYEIPPGATDLVSTTTHGLSYELIATAFGGYGERVNLISELPAALDRALASGKPACINVIMNSQG